MPFIFILVALTLAVSLLSQVLWISALSISVCFVALLASGRLKDLFSMKLPNISIGKPSFELLENDEFKSKFLDYVRRSSPADCFQKASNDNVMKFIFSDNGGEVGYFLLSKFIKKNKDFTAECSAVRANTKSVKLLFLAEIIKGVEND